MQQHEMEHELEHELEGEGEGEQFIGGLLGGLLGEGEGELEFEGEMEQEFELEGELEHETEGEGEMEQEHFFGAIANLARRVVPMVQQAISGGSDEEFEHEHEMEFEHEHEHEMEFEHEGLSEHEAMAELMATEAARASSLGEMEAMIGAAVAQVLSPAERRAIGHALPQLVRAMRVLVRILGRRRRTRRLIRLAPGIVKRTARTVRKMGGGKAVPRRTIARIAAAQTKRALRPQSIIELLRRNLRAAQAMNRSLRARLSTVNRPKRRGVRG